MNKYIARAEHSPFSAWPPGTRVATRYAHAKILVEVAGVLLALGADQLVSSTSTGTSTSTSDNPTISATATGAAGSGGGAPQHIRRAVTRLGPNFVKIGQALASRPDLVGEAIAGELLLLQDAMPMFSNEVAMEFIREVSVATFSHRTVEIVSTSTAGHFVSRFGFGFREVRAVCDTPVSCRCCPADFSGFDKRVWCLTCC